ncbi:MAG: hypothetical protein OXG19_04760 [Chloroflexi bacterium]|nr:hypothetical protein [Chloroflexota bacterium]
MSDATPRNHEGTGDEESREPAEEWRVELIGRTDTLIFVEVRDGHGGVWSGSLPKIEPPDAG